MASKIKDQSILNNENIVKVITKTELDNENFSNSLKFQRKIDHSKTGMFLAILVYMLIKLRSWKKIVKLEQSKMKLKISLEQLRATDNDIKN